MAIPIIPIIMAVTALAGGVTKAVSGMKNVKAEAKLAKKQAEEQINERAREAAKLMSQQKSSFLKGGVYFDGTPEQVIGETYDFMNQDIDALKNNANTNIKNIMRQGRTAFVTSLLDSVTAGLGGFLTGMKATGSGGGNENNSNNNSNKKRNVFNQNNLTGGFGSVDGTNNKIA